MGRPLRAPIAAGIPIRKIYRMLPYFTYGSTADGGQAILLISEEFAIFRNIEALIVKKVFQH